MDMSSGIGLQPRSLCNRLEEERSVFNCRDYEWIEFL